MDLLIGGSSCFSGGEYKSPTWWQIYNKLKHDRIANLRKAQLEVAIESLCGLHLSNCHSARVCERGY